MKDNADYSQFVDFLKAEREIYVQCPCCDKVMRLSELRVFYGENPPKDWLDAINLEWKKIEQGKKDLDANEKKIRADAVQKSRSVLIGKTLEQISPLLEPISMTREYVKHHPRDYRSIWDPVDLICFNGIFENQKVDSVSLIEIKTGSSDLSSVQRSIKEAVEKGKVYWETYKISPGKLMNMGIDIECSKTKSSNSRQQKL